MALKSRLKKLNGKGNGVIQLFIELYIYKMLLGLNNNNKKPLGNDNQALEANVNKFA
jgi:hypothetical protein